MTRSHSLAGLSPEGRLNPAAAGAAGGAFGGGVGAVSWLIVLALFAGDLLCAAAVAAGALTVMVVHFRATIRKPENALLHSATALAVYLGAELAVLSLRFSDWTQLPVVRSKMRFPGSAQPAGLGEFAFFLIGIYVLLIALFLLLHPVVKRRTLKQQNS